MRNIGKCEHCGNESELNDVSIEVNQTAHGGDQFVFDGVCYTCIMNAVSCLMVPQWWVTDEETVKQYERLIRESLLKIRQKRVNTIRDK